MNTMHVVKDNIPWQAASNEAGLAQRTSIARSKNGRTMHKSHNHLVRMNNAAYQTLSRIVRPAGLHSRLLTCPGR